MNKLRQLREEAVKNHERVLAFIDSKMSEYGPLLDEFEKLEPTLVNADDGYISIDLAGDKHQLNAAFGILRRRGFEPSARPESKSSTFSTIFRKEDDEGMIFFNFSSTQCRRVKTGTRTREVTEDVYEIVCDEQEYPAGVTA